MTSPGPSTPPIAQVEAINQRAIQGLNEMTKKVFQTRGGRIGSGMGLLLEGLWGYYANACFREDHVDLEVAWLSGHQYNDFALVRASAKWDHATKEGEVLRIEAKSMVRAADESKAHFDAIVNEIGKDDLLLVLVWDWVKIDNTRSSPQVMDHFLGNARELAAFRDSLHKERGGSFVISGKCPDRCRPRCSHVGEPLNASGKRERPSGPDAARVSARVSFAANFGGLTRMIAASGSDAKRVRDEFCRRSETARRYLEFIDRSVKQLGPGS